MSKYFWLGMLVFLVGAVIVAIPDNGPRVITITEHHGPSSFDLIGLTLMIGPWTSMMIYAIAKWRRVLLALGRRLATLTLAAGVTGLAIIAISLGRNGPYWWIGALLAFGGQLMWIGAAFLSAQETPEH